MRHLFRIQTAILIALVGVASLPAEDLRLANNSAHGSNVNHANAAAAGHRAHHGPCGANCPRCHKYCQLEIVPTTVEKSCWDIECEEICIPAIRFPWEKCCEPKCGTVITVKKLKKVTYECPSCECVWTPVCNTCGSCCGAPAQGEFAPPLGNPLPPQPPAIQDGPPVPPPVNNGAAQAPRPLALPAGYRQLRSR